MRVVAANSVGCRYRRNHRNRKTRPFHLARSLSTCLVPVPRNALGSQEVEQTPRFPNNAARMNRAQLPGGISGLHTEVATPTTARVQSWEEVFCLCAGANATRPTSQRPISLQLQPEKHPNDQ